MSKEIIKAQRMIGVRVEAIPQPRILDVFLQLDSSRKLLRLKRSETNIIAKLALAADQVPELTFAERRALLITEAESLFPDGSMRVMKLFGLREKPLDAFKEIVGNESRLEFFARARELGIEKTQE